MTRDEAIRQTRQADQLQALGFTPNEADQLRRISRTLQRWHELECGDGNAYGSWAIERDDNGDGPPYLVHHHYRHGQGQDTVTRRRIADRERGARHRLATMVDRCNRARREANDGQTLQPRAPLAFYVQGDPRGCALYILRPGDVPAGADVSAYYSRGLAVA